MWFDFLSRQSRPQRRTAHRRPASCRLFVEALEDRTVPSFLPPVSYPSLTNFPKVGGFNNDGNLDLVANSSSAGAVSVLLGNGDGAFQVPITSTADGSVKAIGDFNRDGNLDVVTDSPSVLLGKGDGTFQPPMNFSLPKNQSCSTFAVGDLNNDGWLDLVTVGVTTQKVTYLVSGCGLDGCYGHNRTTRITVYVDQPYIDVLLGKGDGTFSASSTTASSTTLVGRVATAPIPACSVTLEALVAEQLQPVRMRLSRQQL